jgi:hypothetical protein
MCTVQNSIGKVHGDRSQSSTPAATAGEQADCNSCVVHAIQAEEQTRLLYVRVHVASACVRRKFGAAGLARKCPTAACTEAASNHHTLHTCCLCARWPRVCGHGVHHARDEHRLAQQVAVADQLLLHQRHLLRSSVQADVTSVTRQNQDVATPAEQ